MGTGETFTLASVTREGFLELLDLSHWTIFIFTYVFSTEEEALS